MTKILYVISSPRGEHSNSIKLGNAIIDKLKTRHPNAAVVIRDLTKGPFPHLEEAHLNAFFTPVQDHTENDKVAIKHSNEAIAEVMDADVIVIGAPMYNFGVSSTLKSWIDHIARAGLTFKYAPEGPVGLISNKKVYIAVASGGIYSEGQLTSIDFLTPYLKHVLGFMGMTDVTIFRAEGFAIPEVKDLALQIGITKLNAAPELQ